MQAGAVCKANDDRLQVLKFVYAFLRYAQMQLDTK